MVNSNNYHVDVNLYILAVMSPAYISFLYKFKMRNGLQHNKYYIRQQMMKAQNHTS